MAPHNALGTLTKIPDPIKDRIFMLAGREACFAYMIATGGRVKNEAWILGGALYEPFTYWDWQGTVDHGQNMEDKNDKRKRRLLWDRQRGFRANGGVWSAYPSPKRRWQKFQKMINDDNRWFVKRIALAHWMASEDFTWVSEQLPALEALDLSDIHYDKAETPLSPEIGNSLKSRWTAILNNLQKFQPSGTPNILKRLKWLGLSNCIGMIDDERDSFEAVLGACESLETLSLRAENQINHEVDYRSNPEAKLPSWGTHSSVTNVILRIVDNLPDTLRTIEWQQGLDSLDYFLHNLYGHKPNVQRIGIDFAGWVQLYPMKGERQQRQSTLVQNEVIESAVKSTIELAVKCGEAMDTNLLTKLHAGTIKSQPRNAKQDQKAMEEKEIIDERFKEETYKSTRPQYYHNQDGSFRRSVKESLEDNSLNEGEGEYKECSIALQPDPNEVGAMFREEKVNTLLRMFIKLFNISSKTSIQFFALQPEANNRSTDPVHPFALIQFDDEFQSGSGSKYKDIDPDREYGHVFHWINKTFKWRPVFDWDWFVVPEKMRETIPQPYKSMLEKYPNYMALVEHLFRQLKNGGIPIHLLLGRRNVEGSSCYWGWPYEEKNWIQWLKAPFNASLESVAGLVDTLSIYYDLRNPIPYSQLKEIETLQPHLWPSARCPAVPCPWARDGEDHPFYEDCPFRLQRQPLRHRDPSRNKGKQKMANKQSLERKRPKNSTSYAHLANSCVAAPPVGENANDHNSDDSETDDTSHDASTVSLHHLARRAVYTREAVGWQRFWTTYALRFTSLTQLRIRMPRTFDKIGSWRLAKLLDKNAGWQMLIYTDERQHIQTAEDQRPHIKGTPWELYEHWPEAQTWPAGRFVRRSWLHPESRAYVTQVSDAKGTGLQTDFSSESLRGRGKREFNDGDWVETEALEAKELAEAVKRAESVTRRYFEAESLIPEDMRSQAEEERRHQIDLYRHAIILTLQEAWDNQLAERIGSLTESLQHWNEPTKQSDIRKSIDFLYTIQGNEVPYTLVGLGEVNYSYRHDFARAIGWHGQRDIGIDDVSRLAPFNWHVENLDLTALMKKDADKTTAHSVEAIEGENGNQRMRKGKRAREDSVAAVERADTAKKIRLDSGQAPGVAAQNIESMVKETLTETSTLPGLGILDGHSSVSTKIPSGDWKKSQQLMEEPQVGGVFSISTTSAEKSLEEGSSATPPPVIPASTAKRASKEATRGGASTSPAVDLVSPSPGDEFPAPTQASSQAVQRPPLRRENILEEHTTSPRLVEPALVSKPVIRSGPATPLDTIVADSAESGHEPSPDPDYWHAIPMPNPNIASTPSKRARTSSSTATPSSHDTETERKKGELEERKLKRARTSTNPKAKDTKYIASVESEEHHESEEVESSDESAGKRRKAKKRASGQAFVPSDEEGHDEPKRRARGRGGRGKTATAKGTKSTRGGRGREKIAADLRGGDAGGEVTAAPPAKTPKAPRKKGEIETATVEGVLISPRRLRSRAKKSAGS